MSELGAKGEVAMVGYVFSEAWAKKNLDGSRRLPARRRQGRRACSPRRTRNGAAEDADPAEIEPSFDDATFEALRRHYREGIPERSAAENESDAKVLYQFLRELGGEKLVGRGHGACARHVLEGRQVMTIAYAAPCLPKDKPTSTWRGPLVPVLSVAGFLLVWFIAARDRAEPAAPGPGGGAELHLPGDAAWRHARRAWHHALARVLASFVVAMADRQRDRARHGPDACAQSRARPVADRAAQPAGARHHHPRLCLVRAERSGGDRRRRAEQDPECRGDLTRRRPRARSGPRRDGPRLPAFGSGAAYATSRCRSCSPISPPPRAQASP